MDKDTVIVQVNSSAIRNALVLQAEITEEMSRLFRADVYLKTDKKIDTAEVLNTVATISINIDEKNIRYFSGIIELATFENIVSTEGVDNGNILYIRIVPTFARAQFSTKYRSFQERTAIDIIYDVLKENNITNFKVSLQNQNRL